MRKYVKMITYGLVYCIYVFDKLKNISEFLSMYAGLKVILFWFLMTVSLDAIVHMLKYYVQWNLSVTTTSLIKCIICDLFSNVF